MDLETFDVRAFAGRHTASVQAIAFSPDGRTLATTSDDRTVKLWDVASGTEREAFVGHAGRVLTAAFTPDGRTLYTGSLDSSVIAWDVQGDRRLGRPFSFEPNDKPPPNDAFGIGAAFSADGATLAIVEGDSRVRLFDARRLSPLGPPIEGTGRIVNGLAFSPAGSTLAVAYEDRMILWDTELRREVGEPVTPPFEGDVLGPVRFAQDGRTVVVGTRNGYVLFRDARTGRARGQLALHESLNNIGFSPDGSLVALALNGGNVEIWRVGSRRWVVSLGADQFEAFDAKFSPDGRILATGGGDGALSFWDTSTWRRIGRPVQAHAGFVLTVAFDPSGQTLATSSSDGTVKLWDVASHRQIGAALPGPANQWVLARFSPDGDRLPAVYLSGVAYMWDVTTRAWKDRACAVAGRTLTRDEWQDFLPDRPYEPPC